MCYSNSSTSENIELAKKYNKKVPKDFPDFRYYFASGFNFPLWPIITNKPEIESMHWGLVPSWYSGDLRQIAQKTINCRSESAEIKPSFRKLVNSRRCIIPSSGFFEWQSINKEKIPFYIYSKTEFILSMAGLWDSWIIHETGEIYYSFSILTTDANDFMAQINNSKKRMPLFLNSNLEIQNWLSGKGNIIDFFDESKKNSLVAHKIDKRILLSSNQNIPEVSYHFEQNMNQLSIL